MGGSPRGGGEQCASLGLCTLSWGTGASSLAPLETDAHAHTHTHVLPERYRQRELEREEESCSEPGGVRREIDTDECMLTDWKSC